MTQLVLNERSVGTTGEVGNACMSGACFNTVAHTKNTIHGKAWGNGTRLRSTIGHNSLSALSVYLFLFPLFTLHMPTSTIKRPVYNWRPVYFFSD